MKEIVFLCAALTNHGIPKAGDLNVKGIIDVIFFLCGAAAVIFIIVGGISYTTSGGDPGKVKKAKDTIMYAIVGLVLAILVPVIVDLVMKFLKGESLLG